MSEFEKLFSLPPEKHLKTKEKASKKSVTVVKPKKGLQKKDSRLPDKKRQVTSDEIRTAYQLIIGKSARGKGIYTIKDTAHALNKYLAELIEKEGF